MMTPVNSSLIRAVAFDGYHFFVLFHRNDSIHIHPGVPESVFHDFMNARSKRTFYNKHIRGRYH